MKEETRTIRETRKTSEEYCKNPWNKKCHDPNIVLYVYYRKRLFPICRSCWMEITRKNIEWG